MITRTLTILALTVTLSGCVATPRLQMAENLAFDHVVVMQDPMSYNDILCCYDCTV